mmetsp:Transcript_1641/g.2509  ORF Transcript_1641/g.2509 Transcript_1641/m.2509 type:complete len:269 (-) Transcript_1641:432-1238(-)
MIPHLINETFACEPFGGFMSRTPPWTYNSLSLLGPDSIEARLLAISAEGLESELNAHVQSSNRTEVVNFVCPSMPSFPSVPTDPPTSSFSAPSVFGWSPSVPPVSHPTSRMLALAPSWPPTKVTPDMRTSEACGPKMRCDSRPSITQWSHSKTTPGESICTGPAPTSYRACFGSCDASSENRAMAADPTVPADAVPPKSPPTAPTSRSLRRVRCCIRMRLKSTGAGRPPSTPPFPDGGVACSPKSPHQSDISTFDICSWTPDVSSARA